MDLRALAIAATLTRGAFSLDLNLRVEPGEVLGLAGTIGSGKSSSLRLIAGELRATAGSVRLGDTVWDAPDSATFVDNRPVTHLSQIYQDDLPENLTGVEAVVEAIEDLGAAAQDPEKTARAILAELGLGDHVVDRLPWTLSGAEAQRTALARAVAPDPPVLLLDEPFGALDKRTGSAVRQWLQQRLGSFEGCAVVASTNTEHLEELADRLVWLDR